MKVKYVGATPASSIGGTFLPNEERDVPDDVAAVLLKSYGFISLEEEKVHEERKERKEEREEEREEAEEREKVS